MSEVSVWRHLSDARLKGEELRLFTCWAWCEEMMHRNSIIPVAPQVKGVEFEPEQTVELRQMCKPKGTDGGPLSPL